MRLGNIVVGVLVFILVVVGIGAVFKDYVTNAEYQNYTDVLDMQNLNDSDAFNQYDSFYSTTGDIYNTTLGADIDQGGLAGYTTAGFKSVKLTMQSVGVAKNITTTTQRMFGIPKLFFDVFITIVVIFASLVIIAVIFGEKIW